MSTFSLVLFFLGLFLATVVLEVAVLMVILLLWTWIPSRTRPA